jgi:GNAT superfamily N-acetyltransferase
MVIRVSPFVDEYAQVAAGTGEPDRPESGDWLAWDGDRVIGVVHPWTGPDGRLRLFFGGCRPDALAPLAGAFSGECFTTVDRADQESRAALAAGGFAEHRREDDFEIPVTRFDAPIPDGFRIVTADRTTLEGLAGLDARLRQEVPGADGWTVDLTWFREETFDSPFFDPLTYRVALAGEAYAGLARIWIGPRPAPRLGLIAVLAQHRRRGLARALIAEAFAPLADRGVPLVTAEADATNQASQALLAGLGGHVVGGTVELRRP